MNRFQYLEKYERLNNTDRTISKFIFKRVYNSFHACEYSTNFIKEINIKSHIEITVLKSI